MRLSIPNLWIAAMVSPPPAMENAFEPAIALRERFGALGERLDFSNTPTGPFQTMVPAFFSAAGQRLGAVRADVEDHFVGRHLGPAPSPCPARRRSDFVATTTSVGSGTSVAAS